MKSQRDWQKWPQCIDPRRSAEHPRDPALLEDCKLNNVTKKGPDKCQLVRGKVVGRVLQENIV